MDNKPTEKQLIDDILGKEAVWVADGYAIVPIEPTAAMKFEGAQHLTEGNRNTAANVWSAMIEVVLKDSS